MRYKQFTVINGQGQAYLLLHMLEAMAMILAVYMMVEAKDDRSLRNWEAVLLSVDIEAVLTMTIVCRGERGNEKT